MAWMPRVEVVVPEVSARFGLRNLEKVLQRPNLTRFHRLSMLGQEAFVNSFAVSELVDADHGILKLPPLAIWGNLAIYLVAWALLMWPQHLPLGRPCIAMVFAAMACGLREFCNKAWPEEDYPTVDLFGKINPTPIALLFGLMLVNAYLKATHIHIPKTYLCSSAMKDVRAPIHTHTRLLMPTAPTRFMSAIG